MESERSLALLDIKITVNTDGSLGYSVYRKPTYRQYDGAKWREEISEVWSRLFDHRPFLNGEIKFMLKEFEEKRGDREVENLFGILENVTDIKDTQVERIIKSSSGALPVLNEKLDQALKLAEDIDKDYLELHKHSKNKKVENFDKRQKEWDQFIDDMNFKCQRIDNTFEEKEEELRDLYADLNHKLNITSN